MMIAALSKYRFGRSIVMPDATWSRLLSSAHTEYRYAAIVPSAMSVSMFAVKLLARIAAPFRNGHPA